MNKILLKFIIQPMNYIAFFFKTKLLTAAGLWSILLGFLTMVVYSIYNFIVPVWPFVIGVFAFTFLDYLTGIEAAKVRIKKAEKENPNDENKEKITSRGKFRTAQKQLVYVCGLLGVHGIWVLFGGENIPIELPVESPLVYLAAFPMLKSELKSLDENMLTVTGVSFWGSIKKYLPKQK